MARRFRLAPVGLLALGLLAADARAQSRRAPGNARSATPAAPAAGSYEALQAELRRGRFAAVEAGAARLGDATLAATLRAEVLFAQGKGAEAIRVLEGVEKAKGPSGRRARLLLGEYRISRGQRKAAEAPLLAIIDDRNNDDIADTDAEGLAIAGRAAHLLRSPKDANTLFNQSERAKKGRIETLLYRAELFLDKEDYGHAEEVVREALEQTPKDPTFLVLLARVKLGQSLDFDAAKELAEQALAEYPDSPDARAVLAGLALRDTDIAACEQEITKGLAKSPEHLELLSLKAAARFLAEDKAGFEAAKRATLTKNPEYARFYVTVGEYAEWEHRYDDIVAMMREATRLDPDDERAWALLGLTASRSGDEEGGLKALHTAWAKDHFNVRVYNTLNLYEKTIATQYELDDGAVFRVRYPKAEKKVLERYVPRLLSEAWSSMKARYGFVPKTPVQVELYGSREHFSVRTSGLPNIGIQGVCFGRMLAAISPGAESFNWGNVLWHELGHVFAIQMSKNRVPRWFTEGLSEYETVARRVEWRREMDPQLYGALVSSRLPSAANMNLAFTHAQDGLDVTVAYYASSQMAVFTADTFGMGRMAEALRLWGEGRPSREVLTKALGVGVDEYDRRFRAWATEKTKRYKGQFVLQDRARPLDEAKARAEKNPKDATALAELAFALVVNKRKDEAASTVRAALAIDSKHLLAHYIAAKLAGIDKDVAGQVEHLEAMRRSGGDGYAVQMSLADVAEARKDKRALQEALLAAYRFDPTQSDPLKGLFDLAEEEHRDADALEILRRLAPLEQHDRRIWRMLLERLVKKAAWDDAVRVGESALYVDVLSPEMHNLYGTALLAVNRAADASYEAESALLCDPPPKQAAAAHALLARTSLASGNKADAARHRDEALRLDADSADAKAVKIP